MTAVAIDKAKASDILENVRPALASRSHSVQSINDNNDSEEKSASRRVLLAELSNAILVCLACLVKQDNKQLSPSIEDAVKRTKQKGDWDEIRSELDDIFRNLSTWRKTLLGGRLRLIAGEATSTTSAVDVVMSALLIIAHQVSHLGRLIKPWLEESDNVFRKVLETLQTKIKESQTEESRVDEGCTICDKESSERDDPTSALAYLKRLKTLISSLREESGPLRVVLDRLEKYDRQNSARDVELPGEVRHGSRATNKRGREEDTSTPTRRGSSDKSKPVQTRNTGSLQGQPANSLPKDKEDAISEEIGKKDDRPRKARKKMPKTENTV
ncbi:hypothetical protein F5Y01DRAFT_321400 [Xylaria sp. FL0043]|nr:hypothetical protein F5Y01DRAFT_321400 [Xylaria sp. FL0043]